MDSEVQSRFIKKRVQEMPCAAAIRALGVHASHIYMLRERIDCSHWKHVAQYFVKPTPRTYITLHPKRVIKAMKNQALW